MISQETYLQVKSEFKVKKLKPVEVKGKSKPVEIYEVVGYITGLDTEDYTPPK